jgi:hypothetical protein
MVARNDPEMMKDTLEVILIELKMAEKPALVVFLTADGTVNRMGTGHDTSDPALFVGRTKDPLFNRLREKVQPYWFERPGAYDSPVKKGVPCELTIMMGSPRKPEFGLKFLYGSESEKPSADVLQFVQEAVSLTTPWHLEQKRLAAQSNAEKPSTYHDDSAAASDPGRVRLSRNRLHQLFPLGWLDSLLCRISGRLRRFEEMLDEHLQRGDSRAALVVSTAPLLIAAYTDELDCVAILRYPDELVRTHQLSVGSRLLTVNTYCGGDRIAWDLEPGPKNQHRWVNFYPVIADFLSDDRERIQRRKAEILEEEWVRCRGMGNFYLHTRPGYSRDGSPHFSMVPRD